ncbi:MAG: tRNA (adenosine(37)-N6)-threonylcarbamoyltransferase complex ATPase subunit type 1 TsaE [Anaerolineae bacterium]|jgi:tRNA threonylcarbamoyladenosine biosynthesis protein TsaE|nr:tRNA (adenosine(37)-N6)-threonylcarbamoyltransferase complex ATPase subunit type 1 TsaE [Anaerolineae bacterium]
MPILTKDTLEFISRSPDQTLRVGARLGRYLGGGDIMALEGDLGSGKTVFAQGVGMGWGSTTRLVSPTYVLMRRHRRHQDALELYHIDLYRLTTAAEVEMLGLDEIVGSPGAVSLVEWPERHMGLLSDDRLWIHLRILDEYRRSLVFQAQGERHQMILNSFRQELTGQ